MNKNTIVLAVCVGFIAVAVEELRTIHLIREMEMRYNGQSIRLAALTEQLELLDPKK